jgi:hypothetical protein
MGILSSFQGLLGSAWHVNSTNFLTALANAINGGGDQTPGTVAASSVVVADANGNVKGLGLFSTMENAGATKTLGAADNSKVVAFDQAAGSVVTLPAATGSGARYRFYVKTLATSNSHIVYCNLANGGGGSDVFEGLIPGSRIDSGNAVLGFAAASTSNTITLNRTTTGSVSLGEWLEVEDVATNVWQVKGFLSATGAAFATPFSHT